MITFNEDRENNERVSAYIRARYRAHNQCGTLRLEDPRAAKNAYAALFLALNDSAGQPTNASLAAEALHLSASECQVVDLDFDFMPFYSVPPRNPPVCHLVMGADFGPANRGQGLSHLYGTPRLYIVTGDAPDKNPPGFYAWLSLFASKLRAPGTWNRTKVYVLASHIIGAADEELETGYSSFTTYAVPIKGEEGTPKGQRYENVNASLQSSFKPGLFWEKESAFPASGRGEKPCVEGNTLIESMPEVGSSLSADWISMVLSCKSTLNVYIYRVGIPQLLGMGPSVWGASYFLWILVNHLREAEYFPFEEELLNDLRTVKVLYRSAFQFALNDENGPLELWAVNRSQMAQDYPEIEELPIDLDVVQGLIWDSESAAQIAAEFELYTEIAYRLIYLSDSSEEPLLWYEATRNPSIRVTDTNPDSDEVDEAEGVYTSQEVTIQEDSSALHTLEPEEDAVAEQENQENDAQQIVQGLSEASECTVVFGLYPGMADYQKGLKDSRWAASQSLHNLERMVIDELVYKGYELRSELYENEASLNMQVRHMLVLGDEGAAHHHLILVYGQVPDSHWKETLDNLLEQLSPYNPKAIVLETGALEYDGGYHQVPWSSASYRSDGKLYEQPIPLSTYYHRVMEYESKTTDSAMCLSHQNATSDREMAELTENLAFTLHYEWGLPVDVLRVGYGMPYLCNAEGRSLISNVVLDCLNKVLPTPFIDVQEQASIDALMHNQYQIFEKEMESTAEGYEMLLEARRGTLPWEV